VSPARGAVVVDASHQSAHTPPLARPESTALLLCATPRRPTMHSPPKDRPLPCVRSIGCGWGQKPSLVTPLPSRTASLFSAAALMATHRHYATHFLVHVDVIAPRRGTARLGRASRSRLLWRSRLELTCCLRLGPRGTIPLTVGWCRPRAVSLRTASGHLAGGSASPFGLIGEGQHPLELQPLSLRTILRAASGSDNVAELGAI